MGITIGLIIPLLGTKLSAAFVFFMKKTCRRSCRSRCWVSLGIDIQNISEGAIISMPMCAQCNSRAKSFLIGSLNGIVEPLGGLLEMAQHHPQCFLTKF
jgi:hypothetical protein